MPINFRQVILRKDKKCRDGLASAKKSIIYIYMGIFTMRRRGWSLARIIL
jgi:hypothetical protein